MTFQGGDFGGEGHDEATQPPEAPEARPWEEFAPPAYAGQPPTPPEPNAPHNPPPSGPVPPWNPPTASPPPPYPPPGYQDAPAYGGPSYPPPPPPYGHSYPPPGYGGGFGGPPRYPGPYDPYQPHRDRSHETNGLATASLITSVVGGLLGIPLSFFCFIGILIPIIGAGLGIAALSQIKRTNQQGRGLAIAGIAVGATAAVLLLLLVVIVTAAMHSHSITPSLT